MIMKSFEWNRFHKMLLWTFENTKGNLLRMGIIMTIAFFLCEEFVLSMVTFSTGNGSENDLAIAMALSVSGFMVGFTCLYFGASTMFANTRHKKQAISFLMHPASNLEKYLSRWTYVTISWPVVLIVSFFAADYFRVLFNMLMGWDATTSFISMWCDDSVFGGGNLMKFISYMSPSRIMAGIILMLTIMWTHSFYILGSAFFRRHPFILTSLVLMAIQICLAVAGHGIDNYDIDVSLTIIDRCTIIAMELALIALNYWASYKLFKRTNVINNKWINI